MDLVTKDLAELIGASAEFGVEEPIMLGCVRLPVRLESIREARWLVGRILKQIQAGNEAREAGELIVSELVTYAVVHGVMRTADPQVLLVLMQSGSTVMIKVYDTSTQEPRPAPLAEVDSGRGLLIVDALAKHWGASASPHGKCLWAELDVGIVLPDGPEA